MTWTFSPKTSDKEDANIRKIPDDREEEKEEEGAVHIIPEKGSEYEPQGRVRRTREPIRYCDTNPKRIGWGVGCTAILITAIVLIAVSLEKLGSTEYGLQYNVNSKTLSDEAQTGGMHSGPPGYEFIKFPSTFITTDIEDTCVSQDGLRVEFEVTFQYQMPAEWLYPAVVKYRNVDKWKEVVTAAGNSAVHHSCSEFKIGEFQQKRGIIQSTMEDNLRIKLEGPEDDRDAGVYALAISLQLKNVELPSEYSNAVAAKQSAAEEIELARNQRTQETTKAQTRLLSAKEEARKINNTAVNDANVTLTEALLKAEETTFAFTTEAKVIVSVKESLNLTTTGVLAYMSNQLFSTVSKLKVSAAEPAKTSLNDEL